MSDDRFAPPGTEVLMPEMAQEVPEAIRKKIRLAWGAGLVSAAVTLIFVLIAVSGTSLLGFGLAQLLDVAVILGLSFGIYKRSRVCSVLMLLYFVYSKFLMMRIGGISGGNVFTSLLFLYFYIQGVIGTFAYHRHLKQKVA